MRDRPRSPRLRSPRPRSPIMPGSDSYVPGRYQGRRRSRSGGDRYRRDRSRDRDSPRRRERTRSPIRRRSPSREARYDRIRSPRRDWNNDRDQVRDRDRDRVRDRDDRRDDRRRSRSPYGRDRRERASPPARSKPTPRGGSYRPMSRSPSRRGDRYHQSFRRSPPPRESGISSAMTSRPASEKTSPRPGSTKLRSPEDPAHPAAGSVSASAKEASRSGPNDSTATPARSPPCGPAALRASGPGVSSGRNAAASAPSPALSSGRHPQTPGATAASHRSDATSPTNPPSGPRGYVPPSRGGFSLRQGRGGWNHAPSRQISGPSPSSTPGGPSTIPTGPRSVPANSSFQSSSSQQRSFNPPSGPSSQHGGGQRQTLAQSLLANMPALVPGGKLDLSMTPMALGVTRELEPHYRKLRDEEEKLRDELRSKQERLRRSLYIWDKLERDSRAWELRSDLSEKSMKNLAGEGMGGAAF